MTDCPFCQKIAAGGDDYGPVYDTAMASIKRFSPLNPVTPGHTLFVPVAHYERADDGNLATADAFDAAIRYAKKEGVGAYNLIQSNGAPATQTVPHVHVHLVPRREGDGLALPWADQQKESAVVDASNPPEDYRYIQRMSDEEPRLVKEPR